MPQNDELTIEHVAWSDPRAIALRDEMDAEMESRYGSHDSGDPERAEKFRHAFAVDASTIRDTILILDGDAPVAHASLRMLQTDDGLEWEVKRVIVDSTRRGRGLGRRLLNEVLDVARRGGARRVILQVGTRQPEAIRLYTGLGFTPIPVYPPYAEVLPHSFGFELVLD